MLISYEHKFLFIHVPKSAGTSITDCLQRYACRPETYLENRILDRIGIHVNQFTRYDRKRFRGHCSALDVQRQLPPAAFDGLFKFAFVRNPWDLMVSFYAYLSNHPTSRKRDKIARLTFPEFIDIWTKRPEFQQKPRVCDKQGKLLVDFVGYFENLRQDYQSVCQKIGIPFELVHSNRSNHKDYREAYDRDLQALVAERFAADIEYFGYEFDGVSNRLPSASGAELKIA